MLKPKNVVVTNSRPKDASGKSTRVKAYENINSRILYVEYYDSGRKALLGELNPETITWGKEDF